MGTYEVVTRPYIGRTKKSKPKSKQRMKLPVYEVAFIVTLALCTSIYTVLFEDPWDAIDANYYRHTNLIPQRPSVRHIKYARDQAKEKNRHHNKEAKRKKEKETGNKKRGE